MLPRGKRLTRDDFKGLKMGNRLHGEHFTLVYIPSQTSKIGVVISKKAVPKAVSRNLLKRKLSHVLRTAVYPNHSIVVYVKKGADKKTFAEIQKEITALSEKVNTVYSVPN